MIKHDLIPDSGDVLIIDVPTTPEMLSLFYQETAANIISRSQGEDGGTHIDILFRNGKLFGYMPSKKRDWWDREGYNILQYIPFHKIFSPIQLGGE